MKIAFRTDASLQIGTGHVMRCLTLADVLRESGAQSTFVCRPNPGHLLDLIQQRGHTAKTLEPADDAFSALADPSHAKWLGTDWARDAAQTHHVLGDQVVNWLVVDHYALDRRWEQTMRPYARRIMAIDDLADRSHDCDLMLDQNLGRQAKDYAGLLNRHSLTLIGPEYALLRPEFAQWREHSLQRRTQPQLKNLLITMGGVDQTNATGQVLDALSHCELPADLHITVVMGPTAPWLAQVQTQAATMPCPTQVQAGVSNMAQLMAESDLCIGAAGGSAWERCALGLPTLVLILAANQRIGAMALQSHAAAWVAADAHQLIGQMTILFNKETQKTALQKMSQAAANLVTGSGASQVVEKLLKPHV
ncbi:UDP-2,4-diacetamido-2,4,6-trideoxy-beta-L-altropyranose hydrolase [Limnohabitans sp. Bal53]|uniref:UDP-2,4-diacetamido-2,4, 6-trideoxy-beta-L-altropyranose hydrolase n=1 Tax=Limnohabitans sp. Bal53 TaxID=1977910 RepID=UPI000D3532FA|nr:UDP-2,4-diacetamido-2,4,6-trideoxy-beta-L-altropyranose hydrolase [Limnohabitans sp. Bal53]PUE41728.1 UDP-2,4-diacetamido-2,4,6-trideoxy-beta-L-altropyranose hydrolase [Limnohabitans sp. Bal53]